MTLATFIAMLLGLAAAPAPEPPLPQVRTVVIRDEVIMRIPVRPYPRGGDWRWIEHKGPKCISTEDIRGATLVGPGHIDFLMFDRQRVRAELSDDCPALDFYGGFYLSPRGDRVCAGRDEIRSRIGSSCSIDRFRKMERKPLR